LKRRAGHRQKGKGVGLQAAMHYPLEPFPTQGLIGPSTGACAYEFPRFPGKNHPPVMGIAW
jgi:hypothetical protein